MTSTLNTFVAIEIRPWQAAIYDEMRNPGSLKTIGRKIKKMGRDLEAVQALGDADAARGAATGLCLHLLEVAGLTLSDPSERETRSHLLQKWSALWMPDPLLCVVFESTMARVEA